MQQQFDISQHDAIFDNPGRGRNTFSPVGAHALPPRTHELRLSNRKEKGERIYSITFTGRTLEMKFLQFQKARKSMRHQQPFENTNFSRSYRKGKEITSH